VTRIQSTPGLGISRPDDLDACGVGFVATEDGQATRDVVAQALRSVACVVHRGAVAADGLSGDGAGILTAIPREFVGRTLRELGVEIDPAQVGIVTAFLSQDDDAAAAARAEVENACQQESIEVLAWRDVPFNDEHLGSQARSTMPRIQQCLIARPAAVSDDDHEAERSAYRARKTAERALDNQEVRHYFASWSFLTVVYKGLVMSDRLEGFYPDLQASDYTAPFAIYHQRFSTNTQPSWERCQPFRRLAHNGEINTLQGNYNSMIARAVLGTDEVGLGKESALRPVLDRRDSDSGMLDSAVDLLVQGGRDVRHAVAMLVPEPWEGERDLPAEVAEFFRYNACLTEPWDGPAGLVFTDGVRVGAALDRNGLRPLRVHRWSNGLVVVGSEVGALEVPAGVTVRRERLGAGQMLCVDPTGPGFETDTEIKADLAAKAPYARWNRDGIRPLDPGVSIDTLPAPEDHARDEVAAGVTNEEQTMILKALASTAKEPTFSMGDDTPIPPAATQIRPVHHSLKQRFAQVTNPPIDPVRERLVMSLRTVIGSRGPLLVDGPEAAQVLECRSFFVYPSAVETFLDDARSPLPAVRIDATFDAQEGAAGLQDALERMGDEARQAVADGAVVLVLSDTDMSDTRVSIPGVLAVGTVHHRLIRDGVRSKASLVAETAHARDTHSTAVLLGYGADLICPWLALRSVALIADTDDASGLTAAAAQENFQAGVEEGVLKIFSKMGISTVDGYRGAQIFESVGLADDVISLCLPGTVSVTGGLTLTDIGDDLLTVLAEANVDEPALPSPGLIRERRAGEFHGNNPEVVGELHKTLGVEKAAVRMKKVKAARAEGREDQVVTPLFNRYPEQPAPTVDPADKRAAHVLQRALAEDRAELYAEFAKLVNERETSELHDLMELVLDVPAVPLEEVEPASSIVTRFSTGAMSHGALSKEAHEDLAIAMNMVGGKSNCGEGGENWNRFRTRGTEIDRNSRIKQIASGRFGVTPEYCAYADELNIKMAQGSKPGEGGQLPGHKVSEEIADLRHTQPGVGLISPPPHHDIYSIEDLAQLIFDLKQVNPNADVSVKLVSENGVGTIACGVTKALADVVQISGANGGTGASPLSSIKHAGMPWELGLAETQQALCDNGLRDRVKLRADGGMKTGWDVIVSALLGADEYSFGTIAMIAEGCIMARACHKDTCPAGIATQRPQLRAEKYQGKPEEVAAYMMFMAEEVRTYLAKLGYRTMDEAIGQVQRLRQKTTGRARLDQVDISPLLAEPEDKNAPRHFVASVPAQRPRSELDERLLFDGFRALWDGDHVELSYDIYTADRTIGASLGGAIGLEWGDRSNPAGSVTAAFKGSAGQSFGAFLNKGVTLELTGEAQDYVGKGMGGGRIVVRPPADDQGDPALIGNTVLYGATGGELFVAGTAGERFMVRNSGATAVVEGAGDHACEYMTGGMAVILGPVGYNLGAGMTGGEAMIYDPQRTLDTRLNAQLVESRRPSDEAVARLRYLIEEHVRLTGSVKASAMLAGWAEAVEHFRWVVPVGRVAAIERSNEGSVTSAA